jgi:hypothetical protein
MSRVLDGVRHIFHALVARIRRRTGASRAGGVSGRVAPWYPDHFTKTILRPDDLLLLTFEFLNLRVDIDSAPTPQLVRVRAGADAYVIIHFPPQHIAEQAFYEAAPAVETPAPPSVDPARGDTLSNPPVGALLSDSTRIGLHVPSTTVAIPYTLDALLHWASFDLNVTATALPDGLSPFTGTVIVSAGDLAGELAAAARGNVERGPETTSPFVPPEVNPGPLPGPGDPGFERPPGVSLAGFGSAQEQPLLGAQQPQDLRAIQPGIQHSIQLDAQWE